MCLSWLEHRTVTPLTQVRFPGTERDFLPSVNFQCRLSYGALTAPSEIACISICAHDKDPIACVRVRWINATQTYPVHTRRDNNNRWLWSLKRNEHAVAAWMIISALYKLSSSSSSSSPVPAGSPSRGEGVKVYVKDINQPSMPAPFYSVLVSVSLLWHFQLYFIKFFRRLSVFSLCFSVLSLPYWFFQLYVSLRKSPWALI